GSTGPGSKPATKRSCGPTAASAFRSSEGRHSVFRLLPWLDPSPEDSVLAIIVARARATPFEPVHAFDFCAFNFCAFNFSAFNFSPARVGYSPRGQQPR